MLVGTGMTIGAIHAGVLAAHVEFFDVLVAAVAIRHIYLLDLAFGRLGEIALHLADRVFLLLGVGRIHFLGLCS